MNTPKRFSWLFMVFLSFYINVCFAEGPSSVTIQNRQLFINGQPFFVKGVGYAPLPRGYFQGGGPGWSTLCKYTGPYPLNYPEQRFKSSSPDSVYACLDNGTDQYNFVDGALDVKDIIDGDMQYLKFMNANTIRTWGYVSPQLLEKANQYGIKVIAGFWVRHDLDYTFPYDSNELIPDGAARHQALIDSYVAYVNQYKNDPAILMWGLSNENNQHFCDVCKFGTNCNRPAQVAGYFQLINDMALAAKQAEGANFHPTTIVLGGWDVELVNYQSLLTAIDMIGLNIYQGMNFDLYRQEPPGSENWVKYSDVFTEFNNNLPTKTLLITEFGVDAWNTNGHDADPENGFEDQTSQSLWDTSAWDDIVAHSISQGSVANGGVVFHYSDIHRGYVERPPEAGMCDWVSSDWTPSVITHDHGFTDPAVFGPGVFPDHRENGEWWGIVGTAKNLTSSGLEIRKPRQIYFSLQDKFAFGETNQPPVANAGTNQTVLVGSVVNLSGSGTDPENGSLTYTWDFGDGSFANGPSVTRTMSTVGIFKYILNVSDGNLTDSNKVKITVINNFPPYFDPQANKTVSEGQLLSFSVLAHDPDNNPLTYSAQNLPSGAQFDSFSRTFSWTPTFSQFGIYSVTFLANDGFTSASLTLVITVVNVNGPPVLMVPGPQSTNENQQLTFTVSATDPDSSPITYSATGLPGGATFSAATRTFKWTPSYTQAGTYTVTFKATSAGPLTDTKTVQITVANVNRPPVFGLLGNKTVKENVQLSFTVNANDPDNNPLTLSATGLPSGATFNPTTRKFNWKPTFSQSGSYQVTFTVNDGLAPVSKMITITVRDVI